MEYYHALLQVAHLEGFSWPALVLRVQPCTCQLTSSTQA